MEAKIVTQSFKDKLLSIYRDLDGLDIEMVQEDIDKIKNEISGLIAHCDKSESEKEEQLTNDCIHDDIDYKPIQFRTKVEKDEILEEGKDDEHIKVGIKDFIVLGCLIAAVIASIVFLFLL